jgi:hypothetical protein
MYPLIEYKPRSPWNKGKLVGQKPPSQAEGNLVHPDQASD